MFQTLQKHHQVAWTSRNDGENIIYNSLSKLVPLYFVQRVAK
jgi:hypothetical protein